MSPNKPKRQMKLSLFMTGDGNYHMAGWRLPGSTADAGQNIQRWVEAAQAIERARLHMLFIADAASPPGGLDQLETQSLTARIDRMDPIPILSAVAMMTRNVGLAATMTTTYLHPYNLARTMASLDHISGGRAAWNIVTGSNKDDALQFNRDAHPPHAERYERAEEFVDVVRGIWDSYDDDAFPRDNESGVYLKPEAVHFLNHKGKHFQVRGPSAVARSPQGHPVLIQAGSSEPGMNLSARVADVVFTSQSSLAGAKAFYDNVKSRCDRFGRSPDHVLIMPGVQLFIGDTESEGKEKYDMLTSLIPLPVAMQRLSHNLGGIDLSRYDLDAPLPELKGNDARVSAVQSYIDIARRDGLTLRQMAVRSAAGKHHGAIIGSVKQAADQLEDWFINGGADGYNILPSDVPGAYRTLCDKLVPELQRRGLFRTEYEGKTLRESFGLPRPADKSMRARQQLSA